MMTEDEAELMFDRYEDITAAVHYVVNQMTADLPPVLDQAVRDKLNDEFRFWRTCPREGELQ